MAWTGCSTSEWFRGAGRAATDSFRILTAGKLFRFFYDYKADIILPGYELHQIISDRMSDSLGRGIFHASDNIFHSPTEMVTSRSVI